MAERFGTLSRSIITVTGKTTLYAPSTGQGAQFNMMFAVKTPTTAGNGFKLALLIGPTERMYMSPNVTFVAPAGGGLYSGLPTQGTAAAGIDVTPSNIQIRAHVTTFPLASTALIGETLPLIAPLPVDYFSSTDTPVIADFSPVAVASAPGHSYFHMVGAEGANAAQT